jgi:hypothetical protein
LLLAGCSVKASAGSGASDPSDTDTHEGNSSGSETDDPATGKSTDAVTSDTPSGGGETEGVPRSGDAKAPETPTASGKDDKHADGPGKSEDAPGHNKPATKTQGKSAEAKANNKPTVDTDKSQTGQGKDTAEAAGAKKK